MTMPTTVTPEQFADKFQAVIRFGLNWDRFIIEQWPVEVVTLTAEEDLARFYMPWYIGVSGKEVAYDDAEASAVPMRLIDVPKAMAILNARRQSDIQDYVAEFRNQPGINMVTVPTYALPDNQYFVLDGNHRLSALALNSVPFEITVWNVRGPVDAQGLLDLIHWPGAKTDSAA